MTLERRWVSRTHVKGCALFTALFLCGLGLLAGGIVVDVMHGGIEMQDAELGSKQRIDPERDLARKLEVSGLAVAFAAIFGAAGWRFYLRLQTTESDEG